jgi:hypothetical protein
MLPQGFITTKKRKKMADKLFKSGVSDWELLFTDESLVSLSNIISESITNYSTGKTKIVIKIEGLDRKLADMIKKGSEIQSVRQSFDLQNAMGQFVERAEDNYDNMTVKSVSVKSEADELSVTTITIKG